MEKRCLPSKKMSLCRHSFWQEVNTFKDIERGITKVNSEYLGMVEKICSVCYTFLKFQEYLFTAITEQNKGDKILFFFFIIINLNLTGLYL